MKNTDRSNVACWDKEERMEGTESSGDVRYLQEA